MPTLSPSMTSGTVAKWMVKQGQLLSTYDHIFDVAVENLTKTSEKEEKSILEVEILEGDVYVAAILAPEGSHRKIGSPIMVVCEDEKDIDTITKLLQDSHKSTLHKEISESQIAMWQAYVKSKSDAGACGCS